MSNPLYVSGCTSDGTFLVGGGWTLYAQEGFPLELLHIESTSRGYAVDWCEAAADASATNQLERFWKIVSAFLDESARWGIMSGVSRMRKTCACEQDWANVVAQKRANGSALVNFLSDAHL